MNWQDIQLQNWKWEEALPVSLNPGLQTLRMDTGVSEVNFLPNFLTNDFMRYVAPAAVANWLRLNWWEASEGSHPRKHFYL